MNKPYLLSVCCPLLFSYVPCTIVLTVFVTYWNVFLGNFHYIPKSHYYHTAVYRSDVKNVGSIEVEIAMWTDKDEERKSGIQSWTETVSEVFNQQARTR